MEVAANIRKERPPDITHQLTEEHTTTHERVLPKMVQPESDPASSSKPHFTGNTEGRGCSRTRHSRQGPGAGADTATELTTWALEQSARNEREMEGKPRV